MDVRTDLREMTLWCRCKYLVRYTHIRNTRLQRAGKINFPKLKSQRWDAALKGEYGPLKIHLRHQSQRSRYAPELPRRWLVDRTTKPETLG